MPRPLVKTSEKLADDPEQGRAIRVPSAEGPDAPGFTTGVVRHPQGVTLHAVEWLPFVTMHAPRCDLHEPD